MDSLKNLGSVQQKLPCLFRTEVLNEQSGKRSHQPYKVIATSQLDVDAPHHDLDSARLSEKLDGTCVFIDRFQDKPWLWARLDRRPNKPAERKFKKFQSQYEAWQRAGKIGNEPVFHWDPAKDLKEVPATWIPAFGVPLVDGLPYPDKIGHVPGWVPLQKDSRQYCWHLSSVDLENGLALILREDDEYSEDLVIEARLLSELEGHTAELIGTYINGNPYGIGSKQTPIHLLALHGIMSIKHPPDRDFDSVKDWMQAHTDGRVEGLVWHCRDGKLFKVHRNHVGLPWPIEEPRLSQRRIHVNVDIMNYQFESETSQFVKLSKLTGSTCNSLLQLHRHLDECR